MTTQPMRKRTSPFEYFLYLAICAETGLAAMIYKVIFRDPDLANLRVYFALFYFAFLAWAIAQLNMLHRERNKRVATPDPVLPEVPTENTGHVLGLTSPQLVIVVVVFATAVATFSCALRLLR
jgi:Na+/H+ antiporter NhaC